MRQLLVAMLFMGAGIAQAAPKVVWSTMLNVPIYTAPQATNGRLNLTSTQPDQPNVFALDGRTGSVLWRFATQGAITIPPTLSATQVFVASDIGNTHFLRAIDAATGLQIWQYARGTPPECMCSQPSILSGNLLFAQSDGHSLYAFAPNGDAPSKRLWQFPGDGAALTSPVVADGHVIFGSGDHDVYALDAKTGAVQWTATTGYIYTASPTVDHGIVIIGDQGGNINGFDIATGKPRWSYQSGAIDNAAIVQAGIAYVVSEDHFVYALDVKSGRLVWQYGMADYAQYAPVIAGNRLVVANRAGELLALDLPTGKLAWSTELGGTPFSQPLFWPRQKAVVLKIDDHRIGAFNIASGKLRWLYATPKVVTSPVVAGDAIVAATSAGQVVALQ